MQKHKKSKGIALVLPSLAVGGAELMSIHQINYLYDKGFNVFLIILSKADSQLLDQLKIPESHVLLLCKNLQVLSTRSVLTAILQIPSILYFIRQHEINKTIAHLPIAHLQMRMVKLCGYLLLKNYRLFHYHHSLQYQASPQDTLGKYLFNLLNSFIGRFTDNHHIFISHAVAADIQKNFFIKSGTVIYNSVPQKRINASLGTSFINSVSAGKLKGYKILLVPGRIHPIKGHFFLIQAYAEFIRRYPTLSQAFRILIAGGGAYQKDLLQCIKDADLENQIYVSGQVSNELLLSLLKSAYLTIVPSIYEGLGNVVIEGLMQQSLMLVSNGGGLDEVIKDGYNGYKFQAGDCQDFVGKLSFILKHKTQLIDSENMSTDYQKKYTIERQMQQIIRCLMLEQ